MHKVLNLNKKIVLAYDDDDKNINAIYLPNINYIG